MFQYKNIGKHLENSQLTATEENCSQMEMTHDNMKRTDCD